MKNYESMIKTTIEKAIVEVESLRSVEEYVVYHKTLGSTPKTSTSEAAVAFVEASIDDFNTVLNNLEIFADAEYANYSAQQEVGKALGLPTKTFEQYLDRFDAVSVARKIYDDNILKVYKQLK